MMNATVTSGDDGVIPVYWGYVALLVTIIFWGTFYLPVKKFETGNGLFFQLFLCFGVWSVSFAINWIRDFPQFFALPLLCGVLWSAGNLMSVPIIKFIGLSLGQPLWDGTALIVGWSLARFGLLGSDPQIPKIPVMNYIGTAISATSCLFFIFVKSEVTGSQKNDTAVHPEVIEMNQVDQPQEEEYIKKMNPSVKRIIGLAFAIFSGVMYGLNYAPILYIIDNYEGASKNELDYLFSFCSGTLMASVVYFLIYCIFKKNKPTVYPQVVLPAFVSGCMWCVANACFLIANTSLSQTVTFPIGISVPPMLAACIGIVVFKEIKGLRNLLIIGVGFCFALVGSILSGLSQ